MKSFVVRYKYLLLLTVLFLMGLVLRTYNLQHLPAEMHRDEVSIGYSAYSVLLTGKEEHGIGPWPLSFISFGDGKLPGMVYTTALGIKLFGLNVFGVRILNAFLASTLVVSVFFLIKEITNDNQKAILASFLVTFSIWHTFLARTVYEPITGLSLGILSLLFFLKGRNNTFWFIPSLIAFILSLITYNMPMLLLPIMFVLSLVIFRKKYLSRNRINLYVLGLVFLITFGLVFKMVFANASKKVKTTIISDPQIIAESQDFFAAFIRNRVPYKVSIIYSSQFVSVSQRFVRGYLAAFDLTYLFFTGGNNNWHSLDNLQIGDLNLVYILLLPYSLIYLARKKKLNTADFFLLGYFLLSPIPDALTVDAPNTNRLQDFHLSIILLSVIGLDHILNLRPKKAFKHIKYVSLAIIISVFLFSVSNFWLKYFVIHQDYLHDSWFPGLTETIKYVDSIAQPGQQIYIDPWSIDGGHFTYIYWAFHTAHHPKQFQQTAEWNTDTVFLTSKEFSQYHFIELPNDLAFSDDQKAEFFPTEEETAIFVIALRHQKPSQWATKVITDSQGKHLWEIAVIKGVDLDQVHRISFP